MVINDFYEINKLPAKKDYKIAERGLGFIVPGPNFLASVSPDESINYIALLRYATGESRGNHYHKVKKELLIVLDGKLKVELFDPENIENQIEIEIEAGDMLTIHPNCSHTLTALTHTAVALELSPQKLDLDDQFTSSLV